jgi:DNA-binding transcriptional LysR family regulator
VHLDLRMLRAFVAVEQTGSYTDAARELRFSTPAVSAQVQALEKGCGVRLVRRQGPRIVLTEAGRRAAPLARLMLATARELEQVGTDLPDRALGVKTFPTNAEEG